MSRFVSLETYDVRFPTSRELDGSDAMNPDPDYSAAYVVLRTDAGDGLEGHGFAFTIGRGNDIEATAIEALRPFLVGRSLEDVLGDLGGFWKELVHDSQLRWLGPEKGVMHMAISAVVNAVWGPGRQARRQAALAAAGRDVAGRHRGPGGFPVPDRRAHPGRGAGHPGEGRARPGRAGRPAARAGVPGLQHLARLARVRRR